MSENNIDLSAYLEKCKTDYSSMEYLVKNFDTFDEKEKNQIIDAFRQMFDLVNHSLRSKALGILLKLQDSDVDEKIVQLLYHSDKNFRSSTANLLKEQKWVPEKNKDKAQLYALTANWNMLKTLGNEAIDALISHLKYRNGVTKEYLNVILLLEEAAEKPLTALLEDSDKNIRSHTYFILGQFKGVDHLSYLERALEDSSLNVRCNAIYRGFPEVIAPKLLPKILEIYEELDESIKPFLLPVLAKYQGSKIKNIIIEATKNQNERFQHFVALALPHIIEQLSKDTLLELYESKNVTIKEAVLKQFAVNPDTKIVENAIKLLKSSKEKTIRSGAIQVLRNSKDDIAVTALMEAANKDLEVSVKNDAIKALGISDDKRALDFVIDYFNQHPDYIKVVSFPFWEFHSRNLLPEEILAKIHKEILSKPYFLRDSSGLVNFVLENEDLKTKVVNFCNKKLKNKNRYERVNSVHLLLLLMKETAFPFFLKYIVNEKDSNVIDEIIKTIVDLNLENHIQFFEKILFMDIYPASMLVGRQLGSLNWKPKDEREEIIYLIIKQDSSMILSKGELAYEVLLEYFQTTDSYDNKYGAFSALEQLGGERAIPTLVKLMMTDDKKKGLSISQRAASTLLSKFKWKPESLEEKITAYLYAGNYEELIHYPTETLAKINSLIPDRIHILNDTKLIEYLKEIKTKEALSIMFYFVKRDPYYRGQWILKDLEKAGWKAKTEEEKILVHLLKYEWSSLLKFKEKLVPYIMEYIRRQNYLEPSNVTEDFRKILLTHKAQLLPFIKKELKIDENEASRNCLIILGEIGDKESLKILLDFAKNDTYEGLGGLCTSYLANKATKDMIPDLLKVLRNPKVNLGIREIIGNTIRGLDHQWTGRDAMFYYFVREPIDHRRIVEYGLRAIKPIMKMKDKYSGESQYNIVKGFGEIGGKAVIEPLLVFVKTSYGSIAALAAKTLGDIGDTSVIEALEYASLSADEETKEGIQNALYKLKGPLNIQTFYDILKYEAFQDINEDELKQFFTETSEAQIIGVLKAKTTTDSAFIFEKLAKLADYCQLQENKAISIHFLNKLLDSRKNVLQKSGDKINKGEIKSIVGKIVGEEESRFSRGMYGRKVDPVKDWAREILNKIEND